MNELDKQAQQQVIDKAVALVSPAKQNVVQDALSALQKAGQQNPYAAFRAVAKAGGLTNREIKPILDLYSGFRAATKSGKAAYLSDCEKAYEHNVRAGYSPVGLKVGKENKDGNTRATVVWQKANDKAKELGQRAAAWEVDQLQAKRDALALVAQATGKTITLNEDGSIKVE